MTLLRLTTLEWFMTCFMKLTSDSKNAVHPGHSHFRIREDATASKLTTSGTFSTSLFDNFGIVKPEGTLDTDEVKLSSCSGFPFLSRVDKLKMEFESKADCSVPDVGREALLLADSSDIFDFASCSKFIVATPAFEPDSFAGSNGKLISDATAGAPTPDVDGSDR